MLTHNTLGRNGRLGNQMFQYASTKGIALNNNLDYQIPKHDHLLFDCFEMYSSLHKTNPAQGLLTYNEPHFHFDENLFTSCPDDRDLFGYFQTEKYFKNIKDEIKKDFTFKSYITESVLDISNIINSSKVFSIHFRRTDYSHQQDAHPFPSEKYYVDSINKFLDLNYDFGIVFSDDIEWCMHQDILNSDKIIFSRNNNYTDLYLMSQCHGHIMANSSFSWWGAWLSVKQEKNITVPDVWFGPKLNHDIKDLIPEDWKVL
jgi:hypothetical protein